ncbi:hypothetical protein [Amorphus sp. MBR-141]
MRIYAKFFEDGRPSGFWLEGVNDSHQPDGCTEITEAQWQALLQPGKMWDGSGVGDYVPPQPTVTANHVREEARRRLALTDWYVTRAADPSDGTPVPPEILAHRSAIRTACDAVLAEDPIPVDFADDDRWS